MRPLRNIVAIRLLMATLAAVPLAGCAGFGSGTQTREHHDSDSTSVPIRMTFHEFAQSGPAPDSVLLRPVAILCYSTSAVHPWRRNRILKSTSDDAATSAWTTDIFVVWEASGRPEAVRGARNMLNTVTSDFDEPPPLKLIRTKTGRPLPIAQSPASLYYPAHFREFVQPEPIEMADGLVSAEIHSLVPVSGPISIGEQITICVDEPAFTATYSTEGDPRRFGLFAGWHAEGNSPDALDPMIQSVLAAGATFDTALCPPASIVLAEKIRTFGVKKLQ